MAWDAGLVDKTQGKQQDKNPIHCSPVGQAFLHVAGPKSDQITKTLN